MLVNVCIAYVRRLSLICPNKLFKAIMHVRDLVRGESDGWHTKTQSNLIQSSDPSVSLQLVHAVAVRSFNLID